MTSAQLLERASAYLSMVRSADSSLALLEKELTELIVMLAEEGGHEKILQDLCDELVVRKFWTPFTRAVTSVRRDRGRLALLKSLGRGLPPDIEDVLYSLVFKGGDSSRECAKLLAEIDSPRSYFALWRVGQGRKRGTTRDSIAVLSDAYLRRHVLGKGTIRQLSLIVEHGASSFGNPESVGLELEVVPLVLATCEPRFQNRVFSSLEMLDGSAKNRLFNAVVGDAEESERRGRASKSELEGEIGRALNLLLVASGIDYDDALQVTLLKYLLRQRRESVAPVLLYAGTKLKIAFFRDVLSKAKDGEDAAYWFNLLASDFSDIVPALSQCLHELRKLNPIQWELPTLAAESKFGSTPSVALEDLWRIVRHRVTKGSAKSVLRLLEGDGLLPLVYGASSGSPRPQRRAMLEAVRSHCEYASAVALALLEVDAFQAETVAEQLDTFLWIDAFLSADVPEYNRQVQADARSSLQLKIAIYLTHLHQHVSNLDAISCQQINKTLSIPNVAVDMLPFVLKIVSLMPEEKMRESFVLAYCRTNAMEFPEEIGLLLHDVPEVWRSNARTIVEAISNLRADVVRRWWQASTVEKDWRQYWKAFVCDCSRLAAYGVSLDEKALLTEQKLFENLRTKVIQVLDDPDAPEWLQSFITSLRVHLSEVQDPVHDFRRTVQHRTILGDSQPGDNHQLVKILSRWLRSGGAGLLELNGEASVEEFLEAVSLHGKQDEVCDSLVDLCIAVSRSLEDEVLGSRFISDLTEIAPGVARILSDLALDDDTWMSAAVRELLSSRPTGGEATRVVQMLERNAEWFSRELTALCLSKDEADLFSEKELQCVEQRHLEGRALEFVIQSHRSLCTTVESKEKEDQHTPERVQRRIAESIAPRLRGMESSISRYLRLRERLESLGLSHVRHGMGAVVGVTEVTSSAYKALWGRFLPGSRWVVRTLGTMLASGVVVEPADIEPIEGRPQRRNFGTEEAL